MRYALLLGSTVLLVGCGAETDRDTLPPERALAARAFDGWNIAVSIRPSGVSPVVFSVEAPRAAPRSDSHPWVQHQLVLENTGNRRVQFADTESSAFIGAPGTRRLIAADEGCGYAIQSATAPVEAGVCRLSLDSFDIKPHATKSRKITLFKGLRGMKPLIPGRYTFKKAIRFRIGHRAPAAREGRRVVLQIVYRLTRR
jgi:hypothetical protein